MNGLPTPLPIPPLYFNVICNINTLTLYKEGNRWKVPACDLMHIYKYNTLIQYIQRSILCKHTNYKTLRYHKASMISLKTRNKQFSYKILIPPLLPCCHLQAPLNTVMKTFIAELIKMNPIIKKMFVLQPEVMTPKMNIAILGR